MIVKNIFPALINVYLTIEGLPLSKGHLNALPLFNGKSTQ